MRKVRSGEPFKGISASDWNAFVDTYNDVQRLKNAKPIMQTPDSGIAWVKNTTAETLQQFSVVGLDDAIVTDPKTEEDPTNEIEFRQQKHVFNAVAPSIPKHEGKWAVTLDVIAPNAIGRVRIDGVVIVKGAWGGVGDASSSTIANRDLRKFAEAIGGDTSKLAIGSSGSAQVLWLNDITSDSEAGEGWAVVRIGNASKAGIVRFTLSEDLAAFGLAGASIVSSGADDGESIEVTDWAGNAALTGDSGLAWRDGDSYYVIEILSYGGVEPIKLVLFTLEEDIDPTSHLAGATIVSSGADDGESIEVTDWAENGGKSGDSGVAWRTLDPVFGEPVYIIIEIKNDSKPQFITGSMASGGSTFEGATAETFTLGTIVGVDKEYTGASTLEVTNPQLIKVWMNGSTAGDCLIKCQWNQDTEEYEVISATQKYVVQGVRINASCVFQLLNSTGTQNLSGTTDFAVYAATTADWVTSVYVAGANLKYDKRCTENNLIIELTECE